MTQEQTPIQLTSIEPHVFWALYYWMQENNLTPQILIGINENVKAPSWLIKQKNHLVLNIREKAVKNLVVNEKGISFGTMFNGMHADIYVPFENLIHIHTKEETGLIFQRPLITSHFMMSMQEESDGTLPDIPGVIERVDVPQENIKLKQSTLFGTQHNPLVETSAPEKGSHLRVVK